MGEPGLLHGRREVLRLQDAHTAHIEACYAALSAEPGNPLAAEIVTIGETTVFAVDEDRLENRVILTGNEGEAELDEVFAYFDRRGVKAFIEVNPANFLRSNPFSWKSEMVQLLLDRGCEIDAFRCVWYLDAKPDRVSSPRVEQFDHLRFGSFLEALDSVYPDEMARDAEWVKRTQIGSDWLHYIGFEADRPVSTGTLFVTGNMGYLAWWYTNPAYRSRGHQTAGIRTRAADAFDQGCVLAFTVSDFNIQSSMNLQKVGFRIAYNYLLMTRNPSVTRTPA